MDKDDGKQICIQVLAAKEDTGAGGRAVAVVRDRVRDVVEIGREQGAVALLVCPAPEEFSGDGIDLVVAARFGPSLTKRRFAGGNAALPMTSIMRCGSRRLCWILMVRLMIFSSRSSPCSRLPTGTKSAAVMARFRAFD
jgi:hypothetical protein